MEEKPSYYAIIPAEVRYDNDLRANEKLLYGEITALSKQTGECWAGNNYFCELYNVKPNAIAVWIRHLKEKGYIDIEYKYKGKEIQQRIIRIGGIQKDSTYYSKEYEGIHKKIPGGIQKDKENNININNTSINNIKENIKRKYFENEELNNIFLEFLDLRKKLKAVNSDRAINSLLKTLDPYDDETKYKMIEKSIVNSWKGLFELKLTKEELKKQKELEIQKWLEEEENE
jgi:hypothetical protein